MPDETNKGEAKGKDQVFPPLSLLKFYLHSIVINLPLLDLSRMLFSNRLLINQWSPPGGQNNHYPAIIIV